jgi:hypothetical protein
MKLLHGAIATVLICPLFPTQGRAQVRDLGRTGDDLPNLLRYHQEGLDEGTRRCECHGSL